MFDIIDYYSILQYFIEKYKSLNKHAVLFAFFGLGAWGFFILGFGDEFFEGSIRDSFIARGRIISIVFGLLFSSVAFYILIYVEANHINGEISTDDSVITEMNAADAMEGATNYSVVANAVDAMEGTTNDSMVADAENAADASMEAMGNAPAAPKLDWGSLIANQSSQ